jgi:hypothetical protein
MLVVQQQERKVVPLRVLCPREVHNHLVPHPTDPADSEEQVDMMDLSGWIFSALETETG